MTFYNLNFLVLMAMTVLALAAIQALVKQESTRLGARNLILLFASYAFICLVDWRFCLSIGVITAVVYISCLMIKRGKQAKLWLTVGVVVPLASLLFFKYLNFFIESIQRILGTASAGTLGIIAPIGISFFSFTAISYVVDVYKGKVEQESSFINTALYISFFPKLISGPIVRSTEFLPQLKENRRVSFTNLEVGVQIFLFGFIKKVVLADHLGVFVNDVYASPSAFSSATVILAVISYSLQIYLDFSGYSDMAIGIAKCLGFDFSRNFNLPYISRNLTEFWKRWHISLSIWLQEYLYIPLGGSRKGRLRTYINLMITMLLSGLWHGASLTFIAWGCAHGLGLVAHKVYVKVLGRRNGHTAQNPSSGAKLLCAICSTLLTFMFTSLAWVLFRAENFGSALEVLKMCFVWTSGIQQPFTWSFVAIIAVCAATFLAWEHSRKQVEAGEKDKVSINGFYPILSLNRFWSLVAFFTILGLALILAYTGSSPFIYGKF